MNAKYQPASYEDRQFVCCRADTIATAIIRHNMCLSIVIEKSPEREFKECMSAAFGSATATIIVVAGHADSVATGTARSTKKRVE